MSTSNTDDMRQHFEPDGSPARPPIGDAGAHCAPASGSALSPYHCPKCGKLKLTPIGKPHKCGPTDKQRIEMLSKDSAALWSVRQHLHDYLEPDNDVPEAARRAVDELASRGREIAELREVMDDLLTFFGDGHPAREPAERLLGRQNGEHEGRA